MSKMSKPRHNIISVRITDQELMTLKKITKRWQTTTSRLMRGALEATIFSEDRDGAEIFEQSGTAAHHTETGFF